MTPLLPKLTTFRLSRFEPLFREDITISIPKDLFLVAGGNGIGKTTIMQAVVYCMAGELDLAIEHDKSRRWDASYFRGRLTDHTAAYVEIGFNIGEYKAIVRRGFKSQTILYLSINGEICNNPRELDAQYENFITQNCGYQAFDDFRFIFHKLCYLPETRPDLVWNLDTQIRILMTLFSDVIDENQFREQRENLKNLDSTRRHITVAINKAKAHLASLLSYEEDSAEDEEAEKSGALLVDLSYIDGVKQQLSEIYTERLRLHKELREATKVQSALTTDVESLETQLSDARESFLLSKLAGFEKQEARMAMHKLLFLKLCPACGSKTKELSQRAEMLAKEKCCPLCGANDQLHADIDLPQLDAELAEKIAQQMKLEKSILQKETLIDHLNEKESALQTKLDKFRIAEPTIASPFAPPRKEEGVPSRELKNLEMKHSEIDLRFNKLQSELDSKYSSFYQAATSRLKKLHLSKRR